MNIGILSFRSLGKRFAPEERRLAAEAEKRGHKVHLLRYQRCMMSFDGNGELGVKYGNRPFPELDLIIPRASVLVNAPLRASVIEQLQLMEKPMLNEYNAIMVAKNKLQTLQTLSYFGVPVVKTAVVNNSKYLKEAVDYIGTFPIIMKTTYGSYGNGVAIVESHRSVKSTYGILSDSVGSKNIILLQEYIEESKGKDIRLFVIGGRVVAAMQRSAADGDFRSNVGQGGTGMVFKPTAEQKHLAIKATKAIGLEISGVDIIETKHGPAIMEVNANPGFMELEKASGENIAEKIIKYAERFRHEYVPREIV